jgi:hypothetical protein
MVLALAGDSTITRFLLILDGFIPENQLQSNAIKLQLRGHIVMYTLLLQFGDDS